MVARDDGNADAVLAGAPTRRRRDVRAAIPRPRRDGAKQRGVSDARGRSARSVGEHRIARVRADVGLRGGRDRQGPGRGQRHVRRGLVRAALELGARPHRRGRAGRPCSRLEASDQAPVAARGGFQERPLPGDGGAPRAGRSRLERTAHRLPPADRRRTDVSEPAVRAGCDVHERSRLLHDDRRCRPSVRVSELQARVDELQVRRPDDGVALGREFAHRVRAGVGDRRARTCGRSRPRRSATRAARGQPTHAARARAAQRTSLGGRRHRRKVAPAGSRARASSATVPM